MTNAVATQIIDGNDKRRTVEFGELDEAIANDNPDASNRITSRVYFKYELFDLYKAPNLHIQRRMIEAMDNWISTSKTDQMLFWLNTTDVKLHQGSDLTLEVDGQRFLIRPASPEQQLVLQFQDMEAPTDITEGITQPLRVDGHASSDRHFEITAIDHLYLYGTPQFQARVFEQLALLPGYPDLKQLLDTARRQYATVPDIVLMQCHPGPAQQGPGFDLRRVLPDQYSHLLPGPYTAVLYDPYSAKGLDGLTTLTRMLQQAYDALAPDMLVPTPTSDA